MVTTDGHTMCESETSLKLLSLEVTHISAERCVKFLCLCPPIRRQASPVRQRGCQPGSAEGDQYASWLHQKAGKAENAPTDLPARPNIYSHSVFVWKKKKKSLI